MPGGVQGYDRYAYANNNPIRYNDPSGHKWRDDKSGYWNRRNQYKVHVLEQQGEFAAAQQAALQKLMWAMMHAAGAGKPYFDGTPPPPPIGTPTPCTLAAIGCVPTTTPTATPYTGPAITSPTPPSPHLELSVYVDWSKVDYVDAGIDVFGLGANGVAIIAAFAGAEHVAAGAEVVGGIVETAGLAKSGYELIRGDPSDMLLQQTTNQAERVAVMFARTERIVPGVGFLGNLVSLGINLKPQITIGWVTP